MLSYTASSAEGYTLTRPTSSSVPELCDPDSPRGTSSSSSGEQALSFPCHYASRYALMVAAAECSPGANPNLGGGAVERILLDSANSEQLLRIMRTLTFRLESCAETLGSGRPGGVRALSLLRSLLLGGTEAVLTCSLDLIPVVGRILRACERSGISNSNSSPNLALQGGDGSGGPQDSANAIQSAKKTDRGSGSGSPSQVRVLASTVMTLLLDHHTLTLQRQQRQQRVQEFRFDFHLSSPIPADWFPISYPIPFHCTQ